MRKKDPAVCLCKVRQLLGTPDPLLHTSVVNAVDHFFRKGLIRICRLHPLKAIRNKQEIAGIHTAMQRDGVALVKFLKWLEDAVPTGRETEISIDRKLHAFRAAQPLYMGESFDTIAGYKEHGAIVHYEATPETDVTLKAEGFLLLDSGAQYLDGTTDITRTIALGNLTEEEKTDYTLILKGHIALATAVFPEGTERNWTYWHAFRYGSST